MASVFRFKNIKGRLVGEEDYGEVSHKVENLENLENGEGVKITVSNLQPNRDYEFEIDVRTPIEESSLIHQIMTTRERGMVIIRITFPSDLLWKTF